MRTPIAVASLAVLLAACSGGDDACNAHLAVRSPADGALLGEDADPAAEGFQVAVEVGGELSDGAELDIRAGAVHATSRLKSGRATVMLTLPEGGSVVQASARACGHAIEAHREVVVATSGCAFVSPSAGATLGAAEDRAPLPGLQLDVVAACRDFTEGEAAQLRLDDAAVAEGTFDARGRVTFAAVTLHRGAPELELVEADAAKAQVAVKVNGPEACGVSLSPAPGTLFNLDGDRGEFPVVVADADPERAGLQAEIGAVTDCVGATRVRLADRAGNDLGVLRLTQGRGSGSITAPEGEFGLFPSVELGDERVAGNPVGYRADPVRPSCRITSPLDAGLAEDADPSTEAVEFTVTGICLGAEGGTVELSPSGASTAVAADGTFAIPTSAPAGPAQVTVTASRPSGNRGTSPAVAFTAGAAQCHIEVPGAVTASRALAVRVTSNVNPGAPVLVSVEDPSGGQQQQQLTAVAVPGEGSAAEAAFTLADQDGIHHVHARCAGAEASPVDVELDRVPPVLAVLLPAQVINLAVADAQKGGGFDLAVEVDATSIQDGIAGELAMSCAPGGGTAKLGVVFAGAVARALVPMGAAKEGDLCTFTATAADAAGNASTPASASALFDRTAPTLLTSYPVVDFQLVAPGNPRIDGVTVIENEGGPGTPAVSLVFVSPGAVGGTVKLDQDAAGIHEVAEVGGDGQARFPRLALPQGQTTALAVTLTDAAGNSTAGRRSATVDVIPPAGIEGLQFTVDDVRKASGTLRFDAPAGDEGTQVKAFGYLVRWSADPIEDDAAFDDPRRTQDVRFTLRPADPGQAEQLTLGFAPPGEAHVCVRAVDRVGNRGPLACGSGSTAWDEVQVQGPAGSGAFASFLVPVGDVTGDGVDDLVVADPQLVSGGQIVGGVHLYAGGKTVAAALAAPATTLHGSDAGEACGSHVASGDFDGDGTADLAVGCPGWSGDRGRVLLYFGGSAAGFGEGSRVAIAGPTGKARFGSAVASLGNVDGDRRTDDLWASAPADTTTAGEGFILPGRSRFSWASASPTDSAAVLVPGEVKGDQFGFRYGAGPLGDLDGDGKGELVLPASGVNRVYYFRGSVAARAKGGTMTTLGDAVKVPLHPNSTPGTGEDSLLDGFGQQVIGGRDFDLDVSHYPDLLVSDAYNGTVDLMRGDSLNKGMNTDPSQELEWIESVRFGVCMTAGDLTGDGKADLLVGSTSGAFLYRATGSGGAAPFESAPGRVKGAAGGESVAVVDLDDDGRLELVVGAPGDGTGSLRVLSPP